MSQRITPWAPATESPVFDKRLIISKLQHFLRVDLTGGKHVNNSLLTNYEKRSLSEAEGRQGLQARKAASAASPFPEGRGLGIG